MTNKELQKNLTNALSNYLIDANNYNNDREELKGSATEQVVVNDRLLAHALLHLLALRSGRNAITNGHYLSVNPKAMKYFLASRGLISVPVSHDEKSYHNKINRSNEAQTLNTVKALANSQLKFARE